MSAAREPLHVGISPCPNDTFAFHGLLSGAVDPEGFDWRIELRDVQELNRRLAAGSYDVAKASFAAALGLAGECGVLPVGAALGFGVGPLLLAAPGRRAPARTGQRVLAPGPDTTAALLYRLFHPGEGALEHAVFSEILPALQRGDADFGVCIHEARFVWRERGLALVEDLGERWERESDAPLPLGGLLARKRLGRGRIARIARALGASLDHAWAHPAEAVETMRRHATETGDPLLWAHVELYVNAETRALSARGRAALAELDRRARAAGALAPEAPPLEVVGEAPPP